MSGAAGVLFGTGYTVRVTLRQGALCFTVNETTASPSPRPPLEQSGPSESSSGSPCGRRGAADAGAVRVAGRADPSGAEGGGAGGDGGAAVRQGRPGAEQRGDSERAVRGQGSRGEGRRASQGPPYCLCALFSGDAAEREAQRPPPSSA